MVKIHEAIVVEGRYDKAALSSYIDALIIVTDGFGLFRDAEKLALLRRVADERGLIVLTDPDGAGFVIRNHIKSAVDPAKVKHAYIPDIYGRERRKRTDSKEGKLGVEGVSPAIVLEALRRAGATIEGESDSQTQANITKADLYTLGLSGGTGSGELRRELLKKLALPEHMTPNAMLQTLNALYCRGELEQVIAELHKESSDM